MEKTKITIQILGQECKIIANGQEEELRIRKTAALVQSELDSILQQSEVAQITALVYTALNMGERYCREQEAMENLRVQITESAERVAKLEKELQKLKEKPKKESPRKAKVAEVPMAEAKPPEVKPPMAEVKPPEDKHPMAEAKPPEDKPPMAEVKPPELSPSEEQSPTPKVSLPMSMSGETDGQVSLESITQQETAQANAESVEPPLPTLEALTELAQEVERAVDQTKLPDCE